MYYFKNEELPKNDRAKGLSWVAENLIINKLNVNELKTFLKYKGKIVLSDFVYETTFTECEIEGMEKGMYRTVMKAFKKGLSRAHF